MNPLLAEKIKTYPDIHTVLDALHKVLPPRRLKRGNRNSAFVEWKEETLRRCLFSPEKAPQYFTKALFALAQRRWLLVRQRDFRMESGERGYDAEEAGVVLDFLEHLT